MEEKENLIPKKLHYVWVGGKPLPKSAIRCIESWKKHLTDYEFIKWDETNFPMTHPFVKEMYSKGKWAFVADYIRFWALYNYGGIYLDTDTEVLRPLDRFLVHSIFFGRTSSDGYVSCGVIGSVPRHPFIKTILDEYDRMGETGEVFTSPETVTRIYEKYENKGEISIYEPHIFYPCNAGERCTPEKLEGAYTNHHWSESWVSFRLLRKFLRMTGVLRLLKIFK